MRRITLDRWGLGQLFKTHAATVGGPWQREGLHAALVEPGGPGKAARYDATLAIKWFNEVKAARYHLPPVTMADAHLVIKAQRAQGRSHLRQPRRVVAKGQPA